MRIRLINTGQRRVDALLNRMIRRAIRVNKLRDAQKVGIAKRQAIEAGYVAKLQEQFPDLFKKSKRQYKTLKGAANFISRTLQGTEYYGNAELVAQSIKTVGSLERVTKRQAAGLPPLRNITGIQINKMITQSLNEHGITNITLRDHIRKSYEKSNQWQLHRSWRTNRDELTLKKIIDEGVSKGEFEPLKFKKNGSPYSLKTLRKNFYSPEINKAMEEFETVNNTHIEMHRRAGWVNIYQSEKVQAEIDRLLASPNPLYQDAFQGDRMKALKYIIDEYKKDGAPEGSLDELIDSP